MVRGQRRLAGLQRTGRVKCSAKELTKRSLRSKKGLFLDKKKLGTGEVAGARRTEIEAARKNLDNKRVEARVLRRRQGRACDKEGGGFLLVMMEETSFHFFCQNDAAKTKSPSAFVPPRRLSRGLAESVRATGHMRPLCGVPGAQAAAPACAASKLLGGDV
uniref:Uncharacterized protein n=1 Tax=Toxoplasma gondii TgCATBr9 TaxID=943120 RepID=A0A2T6IJV4_TOXGO|nr:hypothetical protein TGBR9_205500A [Toxoplasma gondii TgCATBr9]